MNANKFSTKNEENAQSSFMYSFDENEKTAELVLVNSELSANIIIPRSVQYNKQEFIIKSIGHQAFANLYINSIQFASDSELRIIHKSAFKDSQIRSITFPSSLTEFEKGWCKNLESLNNIVITPTKEQNILYYDDKFIIGKSSPKSDTYDILIFARRDVEEVTIPPFIKQIAPYAFDSCKYLNSLNFADNSELQIIDIKAFKNTSIQSITIPSHVTNICNGAFKGCNYLQKIEFASNSELQMIGKRAFHSTSFEHITIPSHVKQIGKYAFIFSEMKKFEIVQDSELKIIENGAFCDSKIASLMIPSDIELGKGWCRQTYKLNEITILEREKRNIIYYENKFLIGKSDVESETFDLLLFARRNINTATVPEFIKKISYGAFFACEKLMRVSINSQLETIEKSAFNDCRKLARIEIPKNSKLQEIGKFAFVGCPIGSFIFPRHVKSIGYHSFVDCKKLRILEIDGPSELQAFDPNDDLENFNIRFLMTPHDFFK